MSKDIFKYQEGGIISDVNNPTVDTLADNQLDVIQPNQVIKEDPWAKFKTNDPQYGKITPTVAGNDPWAKFKTNDPQYSTPVVQQQDTLDLTNTPYGDLTDPQRVRDLDNLTKLPGVDKLLRNVDPSKIIFSDPPKRSILAQYFNPKAQDIPSIGIRRAVLPDGKEILFADKDSPKGLITAQNLLGGGLYEGAVAGTLTVLDWAANAVSALSTMGMGNGATNNPFKRNIPDKYKEEAANAGWMGFDLFAAKFKADNEKDLIKVPESPEFQNFDQKYKALANKSTDEAVQRHIDELDPRNKSLIKQIWDTYNATTAIRNESIGSMLKSTDYWKRIFTADFANNQAIQGIESAVEFIVPSIAVEGLGIGSAIAKTIPETTIPWSGTLSKLNLTRKVLDKVGAFGDQFAGAYAMGALESTMEAQNNAEQNAVDAYNKTLPKEVPPVYTIEDIGKEPESQNKQYALDTYRIAYNDIFNANVVPLTLMNLIPMHTLTGKGSIFSKFGKDLESWTIKNPRMAAIGETLLNSVDESHQEVYQQGVQYYEEDKLNNGLTPIDNDVFKDIWGSANKGWDTFGQDVGTTDAALLGFLTSFMMAGPTTAIKAFQQSKSNKEMLDLIKKYPQSDLGSIKELFNSNGTLNQEELIGKISNLNSAVLHESFKTAAEKMSNPELKDYAYQQSISGLVYDALDAGVDPATIKDHIKGLYDNHIKQGKSLIEDSDGSKIKYEDWVSKRLDLVDELAVAKKITDTIGTVRGLPKKSKEALFSTVVGQNYFNNLAQKLSVQLAEVEDKIGNQIRTRTRKLSDLTPEEKKAYGKSTRKSYEAFAEELGVDDIHEPDQFLRDQRRSLNLKLEDAIVVADKYERTAAELIKKKNVNKLKDSATETGVKEAAREKTIANGTPDQVREHVKAKNPDATKEQVDKAADEAKKEITKERTKKLSLEVAVAARQPRVDFTTLTIPTTKEDWEPEVRKNLVAKQLEKQQEEAMDADPQDRYDGRPLLQSYEATKLTSDPNDNAKVNKKFIENKGQVYNEESLNTYASFLDSPLNKKLEDNDYANAIRDVMLEPEGPSTKLTVGEDFFDKSSEESPAGTQESQDPPSTGTPIKDVNPEDTTLDNDTNVNLNSVAVYHLKVPPGETVSSVQTLYTLTALEHAKGLAYLHMGMLKIGDRVYLEVEPGLSRNTSTNWKNVTIQVVAYDSKGERVVIGGLHTYNDQYRHSALLKQIREDIFTQWSNSKTDLVKTGWETTVQEIFKGTIEKIKYKDITSMPFTWQILEQVGMKNSQVEVGLVTGNQTLQQKWATNGARFTLTEERGTNNKLTGTGFPVILFKSPKGEGYYEQVPLFTKNIKDIKGYPEKIIELIDKGDIDGVKTLVSNKRLTLKKDGKGNVYIDFKDGSQVFGGQVIYDKLDLGSFAAQIDKTWLRDYDVNDEILHPIYGRIDVKELIINHLTGTDIDPGFIQHYSYNGHTEDSFIHSSKPAVDPWGKKVGLTEIKDVIPNITESDIMDGKGVDFLLNNDAYGTAVEGSYLGEDENGNESVLPNPVYHKNGLQISAQEYNDAYKTYLSSEKTNTSPSTTTSTTTSEINENLDLDLDFDTSVGKEVPNMVYEDEKAAKEWISKRLAEIGYTVNDDTINKLHQLLKLDNSQRIWGVARDAAIVLASNRSEGTTKHEAFHIVFNLFLTDKQREIALQEALKVYGPELGATEDDFYKDKVLTKRLEEAMARDFEHYKLQGTAPAWLKAKSPKLAKILDDLYNFLYKQYDVLKQYWTDEKTIGDIYRQIENNSLGRDFFGNRRKSYQEVFNQSVTDRINTNRNTLIDGLHGFSITRIPSVSISPSISFINKDNIRYILQNNADFKTKEGQVQSLYQYIYNVDPKIANENLIKVYEEVKRRLRNEFIPSADSMARKATNQKSKENYERTSNHYRQLESLISLEFLAGKPEELRDDYSSSEPYDFTRRLVRDLAESNGAIYDGTTFITDTTKYEANEAEDNVDTDIEPVTEESQIVADSIPEGAFERWQSNTLAEKSYAKITPRLKAAISNVPMTEEKVQEDGSIKTKNKTNWFAAIQYYDPREIFNLLVDRLASTYSPDQMLVELEKQMATDYRLRVIGTVIMADQALVKDTWIGIGNKYKVQQLMAKHDNSDPDKFDTIRIFSSNRKGVVNSIITKFNNVFNIINWNQVTNTVMDRIGGKDGIDFEIFKGMLQNTDLNLRRAQLPILLNKLGFIVTDIGKTYLESLESTKIDKLYEHMNYIADKMSKGLNPTVFSEDIDQAGAKTIIKEIAKIIRNSDQNLDLKMFTNGKNKLVSGHIQAGFIIKQFHKIRTKILEAKKGDERDAYVKQFSEDNDFLFKRDAPIVRWIKERLPIGLNLGIMDSIKLNNEEVGKEFGDMDAKDLYSTLFTYWIGSFNDPKNKQRGNSWSTGNFKTALYNVAAYDSPTTYYVEGPVIQSFDDIINEFYGVFLQEANRIHYLKTKKAENPDYVHSNKNMEENGQRFHFFPHLEERIAWDPKDGYSWADAKQYIINDLNNGFDNYMKELKEEELIDKKESGEYSPINNFPNAYTPVKSFEETLKMFYLNNRLMSTQMITLLSGDPAFYKKDKNDNLTSADYQKRNKALHANGIYPYFERSSYNVQYLQDVTLRSKDTFLAQVNEILEKYLTGDILKVAKKGWENKDHELTDAQGYITLDRWKEIKVALNEWSPQYEEAYKRLSGKDPSPLTAKDILMVTQPIKPQYFGFNNHDDMSDPLLHKYSAIVLHQDLTKDNPTLKAIADRMNDPKHKVDELIFLTGVKVGSKDVLSLEDYLSGTSTTQVLSHEYWKEQQKVPEHYNGDVHNLLGIQLRKLIGADADLNLVYTTDLNSVAVYNTLFNKDVKSLNGHQILELIDTLQATNIREDRNALNKELSVFQNFRKKILDSIFSKGLTSQYTDPLELKAKDEFKLPLSFPTISRKIEEIINSFYKKVSKQTHNGGSYVNISGLGWQDDLNVVINNDGTFHVEVALPRNSNLLGVNLKSGEIEKIQEGIVYRIPTEGKYSMFPIKVVKWLEPNVGGIIAMPREVTTIAGLDFDIDKVYALLYNYKIDKNGYLNVSKNIKHRDGRENVILDLYRNILQSEHSFKDWLQFQSIQPLKDLQKEFTKGNREFNISDIVSSVKFILRNQAGKNLIGIFATHNSFHAIAQGSNAKIDPDALKDIMRIIGITPKSHPNINGSLDSIYDSEGDLISKSFAMLLSAAVDNAKDPVLDDLNINTFTAPILGLMLHLGIDRDTAIRRLNQDDIRLEAKKQGGGFVQEKNIENPDIKKLFIAAKSVSKLISKLRIDSGSGPTLHDVDKKLSDLMLDDQKGNQLVDSGNLLPTIGKDSKGYQILRDNGCKLSTKEYIKVFIDAANLASKYFPYFNDKFINVKTTITNYMPTWKDLNPSLRRLIDIEHMAILHYPLFKIDDPIALANNFPNNFIKFKSEYSTAHEKGKYKELFEQFIVNEDGNLVLYDKNQLDNQTQERIKEAWASALMPDENEDINAVANDLIKYGFLINGYQYTRDSYLNLVPPSFFENNPGFSEYESGNYPLNLITFNIAINNPTKFLTKLPYNFKADDTVHHTKKVDGIPVKFRIPMYYQTKGKDIVIKINKDFIDRGFRGEDELTSEIYNELIWKDSKVKGRAYEFDFNLVKSQGFQVSKEAPSVNDKIQTSNNSNMMNIVFQEEQSYGYRERTIKNASADATIAIAVDFNSAGEKLTKSSVLQQNKLYIPIDATDLTVTNARVDKIINLLNSINAKTLNIAGNGIYTMKGKYTQNEVDIFTYNLLKAVINSPNLNNKITGIRTGGQTGFDEAGAKAAAKLGIYTFILAPKGWKFRNSEGQDITNENQFKSRFEIKANPIISKSEYTVDEIQEHLKRMYNNENLKLPCK